MYKISYDSGGKKDVLLEPEMILVRKRVGKKRWQQELKSCPGLSTSSKGG